MYLSLQLNSASFVLFHVGFILHIVYSQEETKISTRDTRNIERNDLLQIVKQVLSSGDSRRYVSSPFQTNTVEFNGQEEIDPEEGDDLTEGDMIVPSNLVRNGLIGKQYLWPGGIVVFEIDPEFTKDERAKIFSGWEEISKTTCIKFRSRSWNDSNFVFVQKTKKGCSAHVGRQTGIQRLNYTQKCVNSRGKVIHEMLHTLGFKHEQSRPDRDDFVKIIESNIKSNKENNFVKLTTSDVTTYGAPYDYGSVLHYSEKAFSKDKSSRTIIPKISGVKIGQRDGMSQLDIIKLKIMYNCPFKK